MGAISRMGRFMTPLFLFSQLCITSVRGVMETKKGSVAARGGLVGPGEIEGRSAFMHLPSEHAQREAAAVERGTVITSWRGGFLRRTE